MKRSFRGMTLLELLVVVAILAVLAMLVLPKLDGVQSNANHAVGASTAVDTARYVQTYRTMKNRFPDGWDSLMDGTGLWAGADVPTKTKGLHTNLGTGSNPKLAASTLTADEVTALRAAGIGTVYDVTSGLAATKRPSDMFTTARVIADGGAIAIVNSASASGRNIIDRVYRANQSTGAVTGTSGTLPAGRRLMVVGFGPLNELVGKLTLEAPYYPNVDMQLIYGRNLVMFEIGGTGRPLFKGVMGADGDLLDDLTTYMSRDTN